MTNEEIFFIADRCVGKIRKKGTSIDSSLMVTYIGEAIEEALKQVKTLNIPDVMISCQHDWKYSHSINVNDFWVCTKCQCQKIGN